MDFEELVQRLSPKLKAITRRLNRGFAFFNEQDLYQEAVLYLWQEYLKGEINDKTDSFILQACFFFLKNHIRKTRRKIDCTSMSLNGLINEEGSISQDILFSREKRDYPPFRWDIFLSENIQTHLTKREKDIILLCLEGLTTRQIGQKLGISHVMVIKIRRRIRDKCSEFKKEFF